MKKTGTAQKALRFYLEFFKIGCFTFGGGWSIVAQMQKQFVEKEKLITGEELLDMTSIGKSLPGLMIGNISYLFGYHIGGVACGLACVLGFVAPPILILSAVTFLYAAVYGNPYVMHGMAGIRAAVPPIIAASAIALMKNAFPYRGCYAVALLAVGLYLFTDVNCIVIILIGAALGIVISLYEEKKSARREGGGHGAS